MLDVTVVSRLASACEYEQEREDQCEDEVASDQHHSMSWKCGLVGSELSGLLDYVYTFGFLKAVVACVLTIQSGSSMVE